MDHQIFSVFAEAEGHRGSPCDGIATYLQELEELLCLLSVSVLLFSRQSVIWHEQRVSNPPCSVRNNHFEVFYIKVT